MDARLAGYPWLPRMIDKARAAEARSLGIYYRYPCPIDRACLDLLGIDADTFRSLACVADRDDGVLRGLSDLGASLPQLAEFDPVRLNSQLHRDG